MRASTPSSVGWDRESGPICPRREKGSDDGADEKFVSARKYQFMEMNLQKRVGGLKDKIPEIQKTLDTVRFLKLRRVRLFFLILPPSIFPM